MKLLLTVIFTVSINCLLGQDKISQEYFNKLTEIQGTEYVIATIDHPSKIFSFKGNYLLFINTKTGQTKKISFPKDGYMNHIEQVKIDSLDINRIIVSARTVDLDGKSGIEWGDPMQILILSIDGQEMTQLTDNKFFSRTYMVNKQTGRIVVTGYFDSNNNNKLDKKDQGEIHIYDLRTLKLISKL